MSWQYDHIHFKCSDHEQTAAFFKEHFGAREISRIEVNGMAILTLDLGGVWYNFSPKRPDETVDPSVTPPRYGVYHIALKTADLEAQVARLKSRGVRFVKEVARANPTTQYAFIEGPDGISIELLQRD